MPVKPVSFTSPGFDYAADQAEIDRRRKMAELLQAQALTPSGGTETVGGWAIRKSPLEGSGKVAQGLFSGMASKEADEQAKALQERYSSDLARTMMQASRAGSGSPAMASQLQEDAAGNAGYTDARPAVPPDREAMARILMGHPETRQLALQQMAQDIQRQGFMAVGGMAAPQAGAGATQSVPVVAGQGGTSGTPQGVPSGFGGPAGGQPMAVWLQLDPTGKAYTEQLAKDYTELNKPQNVRPQGTVAVRNPQTGKWEQQYYSAPVGEGMTRSPEGAASVVPGYLEGQAALGKTPLEKVTNADQTVSYVPKGQLAAAAMASPIPQAPPTSTPAIRPPNPTTPANFPRETPAQNQAAMGLRQRTLQVELTQEQANLASAKTPEDRDLAQRNIAALTKELSGVKGWAGAPTPAPAGPPRFGQTQEEQIRQQRETAAGKAVDETFAKDYVAFTTGGAQDAMKQIAQLKDVTTQLNDPKAKLTGPFIGGVPDAVLKFTGTGRNAIAMRERVEEVVQRSLRAILGAQFTEKEGERLIARAYNPNLSEKENAIRVGRLMTQLEQAFKNKQDAVAYFEKNNTLQGWKGKLPSMSDFDPDTATSQGRISPATESLLDKYAPRSR